MSTWADAVASLSKVTDVAGQLVKAFSSGYDKIISIFDDQKLRALNARITSLIAAMTWKNNLKGNLVKDLDDFLNRAPSRRKWSDLQVLLREVAAQIRELADSLRDAGPDIVRAAGMDL